MSIACALARRSFGGGMDVHAPATQTGLSTGHTVPQVPQLVLSFVVFTQVMLTGQNVGVAPGQPQTPPVQAVPPVQVTPQVVPAGAQNALFATVLMHAPPQNV